MTLASGVGSWPGTDVREALRAVRDTLPGPHGLPYLPELPGRGPGAELVGRTAGLLVGLSVDLQPSGWRFVDRPGHDARRTAALWMEDLDELAEAFDGYAGRLKVQVAGPWTLASGLALHRGERAIVDEGARRDLVGSLAEGVRIHLEQVQRLLPDTTIVLQLDEPSLPTALQGLLPTVSGFGMLRALDPQVAASGLRTVLDAAGGRDVVIHCCATGIPLPLLRATGAALSVDTSLLALRSWEGLAVGIEDGMTLYAGCVATAGVPPRSREVADTLAGTWHRLGMPVAGLDDLVVTPACGLAALTFQGALDVQQACTQIASELAERATS